MFQDYIIFYISIIIVFVLFFIISMFFICKNKKNIMITIRSITLLYLTNISIILQIVILCCFKIFKINDFFHDDLNNKIINLFFIFHFITFITISCKYFRLLIITNVSEDLNDKYYLNNIELKNYYYEYLYNRFTFIIFFISILIYIFFGWKKDKLFIKPFLYIISYNYNVNCPNNYSFPGSIVLFIENLIYITLCITIFFSEIKQELNIKKEILCYTIINYIYNILLLIFYIEIDKIKFYLLDTTLFYLIFIYINQIILPIYYAIRNKIIMIYELDKDISNDLYLFLNNRKCCDVFAHYLNLQLEKKKNNYFLSLFINILDYRLRCISKDSIYKIKSQGEYIIENFLSNNEDVENFNDSEFILSLRNACLSFLERDNFKLEMFDEILIICYKYLNNKFLDFKSSSHEYINLISELNYQTYLSCKFIQCGLISKE